MSFSLETPSAYKPQFFSLATTAATIRTASVTDAIRCTASKVGSDVSLVMESTMSSGTNLAVTSFTLATKLEDGFQPIRAISVSTLFNTAVGTVTPGYVTIAVDGTVTYTCPTGFTAAAYIPVFCAVNMRYSAV